MSFHLKHRSERVTTIFTHRRALDSLKWDDILDVMAEGDHKGGTGEPALLYISGYFRSSLYHNLVENLGKLSEHHLIAIDHGRVNPEADTPDCARALKEAFRRGFVDIYMCTFKDLWSLVNASSHGDMPPDRCTPESVRALVSGLSLPPVTVIRVAGERERPKAYLILNGQDPQVVDLPEAPPRHQASAVGRRSAFNAEFLRSLLTMNSAHIAHEKIVASAVRAGLDAWITTGR